VILFFRYGLRDFLKKIDIDFFVFLFKKILIFNFFFNGGGNFLFYQ